MIKVRVLTPLIDEAKGFVDLEYEEERGRCSEEEAKD